MMYNFDSYSIDGHEKNSPISTQHEGDASPLSTASESDWQPSTHGMNDLIAKVRNTHIAKVRNICSLQ